MRLELLRKYVSRNPEIFAFPRIPDQDPGGSHPHPLKAGKQKDGSVACAHMVTRRPKNHTCNAFSTCGKNAIPLRKRRDDFRKTSAKLHGVQCHNGVGATGHRRTVQNAKRFSQ